MEISEIVVRRSRPLFDLYNSSDHTQPGPIIAKYLILLFQLVLDGD